MTTGRPIAGGITAAFLALSAPVLAHNNPQFAETLVATVEVAAEPAGGEGEAYSGTFDLPAPADGTVGLVWRVRGGGDSIRFQVSRDGGAPSMPLNDGKMTAVLEGPGYAVTRVTGASGAFVLEIYAASRR